MINIRPATQSDIDAIAAIHAAGWEKAFAGILPPEFTPSKEELAGRHRKRLAERERGRRRAVAEIDGEIRGFVIFGPSRDAASPEDIAEIYVLFVDPRAWRRGLGARLVEHALGELREKGFRAVTLWSARDNVAANAFYGRLGFGRDGAVQRREEFGDVEEVRFRRPL